MKQRHILVAASNEAGIRFIRLLLYYKLPVAAITNNNREEKLLRGMGVIDIVRVHTNHIKGCLAPVFPIGRVFIFESSLPLSCQYLLLMTSWSCHAITIVTTAWHPEVIYKKLGASYIVHSQTGDVGFLLNRLMDES